LRYIDRYIGAGGKAAGGMERSDEFHHIKVKYRLSRIFVRVFFLGKLSIAHFQPLGNSICFFSQIMISYCKGVICMGYFGCHLSASGGNLNMVKVAQSIGANTFAFFTRNPRGSKAKAEDPADCAAAMAALQELSFGKLVAHGSYTMNLCTADPEARAFATDILCDDLRRMAALPGNYYNFHPGSHVGQGIETGIAQISDALKKALAPGYPVTVLLESMAGKGSEVGGSFEQLRQIIDAVGSDQVGVCLDTCHIWDGGYDIVNNLDGVLAEFDRVVGLHRLKALHVNDSKNPLGARKDRHACLGEGNLGLTTFEKIVNHPALAGLPMILETPNELPGYQKEIALLRAMKK
jgi:deoxyribonuclease-4